MLRAISRRLALTALVASPSISAQQPIVRPLPRFPSILLFAGVSGSVRARYVVDTSGRVDMKTLMTESSHPLFSSSVKTALVSARFDRRPQPDRREELFVFSNAKNAPPIEVAVRDSTPDGLPRTTVGYPSLDSNAASTYKATELIAAEEHVLSTIIDSIDANSPSQHQLTFCLADRDSAALRALSVAGRRAVALSKCPRTYGSMIARVDSLGHVVDPAPPRWIDPYRISIVSVDPWTAEIVRVIIDISQGTGGARHLCGIGRGAMTTPAKCVIVLQWAS